MRTRSAAREYYEAILVAAIFALFARTFTVQAFKIPTGSMEDNLLIGDHLLVNKFTYAPRGSWENGILPYRALSRGDVVVFKFPDEPHRDFIKRVVGLPGETLQIVDKRVSIDGKPLDEPYVFHKDPESGKGMRDDFGPVVVPAGHCFVMGDNRDNSHDSRFWGPLRQDLLKGKGFVIYWSYDSPDPVPVEFTGVTAKIRQLAAVAINFFPRSRWERTFRVVR